MAEALLPLVEEEWKKAPAEIEKAPLITTLGLVEGDVPAFLEDHGATTLRGLIRELEWPSRMVMMAVGALVRERLVRAAQRELKVILEPLPDAARPRHTGQTFCGIQAGDYHTVGEDDEPE